MKIFSTLIIAVFCTSLWAVVKVNSSSVSSIRNGSASTNPFNNYQFKINFKTIDKIFVIMTVKSSEEEQIITAPSSVWQINQEAPSPDTAKSDSDKFAEISSSDKLWIINNGGKKKSRYPYKLVLPTKSKFIRMTFLDFVQIWKISSVSGNTVTMTPFSLNADKCEGKVSGLVTIPSSATHKIEASSSSLDGWKADQYVVLIVKKLIDDKTKQATSDQSNSEMTALNMDTLTYATCKFVVE